MDTVSGLKYIFKHPHTITWNVLMHPPTLPKETEFDARSQKSKVTTDRMVSVFFGKCLFFPFDKYIMYTISTFPGVRCQLFSEYLSAKMEIGI